MKKCPFCNAEIDDNARFCLYCMTSLEEKQSIQNTTNHKKRGPWILAAVLVLSLLCGLSALYITKQNIGKTSNESAQQTEDSPSEDGELSDNSPDDALEDETPEDSDSDKPDSTDDSDPADSPTENTPDTEEEPNNQESPIPPVTEAVYLYRDAKNGDDFSVHTDLENAIVIIGISTPSSSGEYVIPETLDGKRVIAIMSLAFCDDSIKNTVKKVFVPSSVKTIHTHAFSLCNNLTDIYFYGNAIYVDTNAFAPVENRTNILTIHCSYDCSDRNYRYYRNSAVYYNAQYEEWNG